MGVWGWYHMKLLQGWISGAPCTYPANDSDQLPTYLNKMMLSKSRCFQTSLLTLSWTGTPQTTLCSGWGQEGSKKQNYLDGLFSYGHTDIRKCLRGGGGCRDWVQDPTVPCLKELVKLPSAVVSIHGSTKLYIWEPFQNSRRPELSDSSIFNVRKEALRFLKNSGHWVTLEP